MSPPRTLSEVQSTCTKAARGCGCPWGLAEEAGQAVRTLQSFGLPGAEALAHLFAAPRDCACCDTPGTARCGLALCAELADMPVQGGTQYPSVASPLLLGAALLHQPGQWQLLWEGGALSRDATGLQSTGQLTPAAPVAVTLTRSDDQTEPPGAAWHSRAVDPAIWAGLEALAARTYVPESETSRTAGAGPDDTDED